MGPTCCILLERALTETQLEELDDYIADIGISHKKIAGSEWDFWVHLNKLIEREVGLQGCLFSVATWDGTFMEIGTTYEIEESELLQLEKCLGFRPNGHISFAAGCNNVIDHALMGRMILDIINKFGGYVDFCGKAVRDEIILNFEGKIFNINYDVGEGKTYFYQVVDKVFFTNFFHSDHFWLVK